MNLEIDINAPEYDSEGKLIHNEDLDDDYDDEDDNLEGVFNAHLLDEELLDE